MTVRGAALLGVGAMVGAGIFALLGEAGAVAGAAVWISFLLAGIVSVLIGYNVVKLGVRYPSSGGLFQYLLEGFGNGRLLGIKPRGLRAAYRNIGGCKLEYGAIDIPKHQQVDQQHPQCKPVHCGI